MGDKLIDLQDKLIDYVKLKLKESTSETLAKDIPEVVRVIIELENTIHPY